MLAGTGLYFGNNSQTKVRGSISGNVHLAEVERFRNGKVEYQTTPCEGGLVIGTGQIFVTEENGKFLLKEVPEGKNSIQVNFGGCGIGKHDLYESPEFIIGTGSTQKAWNSSIFVYESTGLISGVANLEDESIHSNIMISVDGFEGFSTTTDKMGRYQLTNVPVRVRGLSLTVSKPHIPL